MKPFPCRIYLNVTNSCNLRCIHCYRSSGTAHTDELTTEEIINFFKYVAEESQENLITITLTGGEPFCRNDIWAIIDAGLQYEINMDIATNGTFLEGETVKRLRAYPNLNIQLSVDGASSSTVDRLRGDGTFNKIINSLELINKYELNRVVDMNFVTVITRFNYRDIEEIVKLADQFNISKVVFGETMPVGRALEFEDEVLLKQDELKEVITNLSGLRKRQEKVVIVSQFYFDFLFDAEFSRANVCTAESRSVAAIGPSGDVTLCPAFSEDKECFIGNIRYDTLAEIINSESAVSFRKKCSAIPYDCLHWKMCKGGCHILSYKMSNSYKECDPRCPIRKAS